MDIRGTERVFPLAVENFAEAFARLTAGSDIRHLGLLGSGVQEITHGFAAELAKEPVGAERLVQLISGLLVSCARVPLLTDHRYVGEFAILLARSWLEDKSYGLVVPRLHRYQIICELGVLASEDRSSTRFAQATASVHHLIAECLVNRFSACIVTPRFSKDGRLMDHPQAFIASAMTEASDAELDELRPYLLELRWVLEGNGVVVFAPALLRDRRRDGEGSNRKELAFLDERMSSLSDVVFLFLNPPANGIGAIKADAVRFQSSIVLIDGGRGRERRSKVPSTVIRDAPHRHYTRGSDLAAFGRGMSNLVTRELGQYEANRDARVRRFHRDSARLERLLALLESMSEVELLSIRPHEGLANRERMRRLLAHPLLFGAATGVDREALELIDPPHLEDLSRSQTKALEEARREVGWAPSRSRDMAALVQRMVARSPERDAVALRKATSTMQFWMNLDLELSD